MSCASQAQLWPEILLLNVPLSISFHLFKKSFPLSVGPLGNVQSPLRVGELRRQEAESSVGVSAPLGAGI